MVQVTGQPIWPQGYTAVAQRHKLAGDVPKAGWALLACRTAVLGGISRDIQGCPEGHVERVWDHACRHWRCPPCAWRQVERWRSRQKARL